jgi:hypothetical protein
MTGTRLIDGQRIDVDAEANRWSGASAVEDGHAAGVAFTRDWSDAHAQSGCTAQHLATHDNLVSKGREFRGDAAGGFDLTPAQFGMSVKLTTRAHQPRRQGMDVVFQAIDQRGAWLCEDVLAHFWLFFRPMGFARHGLPSRRF